MPSTRPHRPMRPNRAPPREVARLTFGTQLGLIEIRCNDPYAALAAFEEAVKRASKSAALRNNLAMLYTRRAGLSRAIMLSTTADNRYRESVMRQARRSSQQLAGLLERKRAKFDHPDLKLAADFAFRQVFAVLDQTVRFPGASPTIVKLNNAALIKELTRGFLGYIGYRRQSNGADGLQRRVP